MTKIGSEQSGKARLDDDIILLTPVDPNRIHQLETRRRIMRSIAFALLGCGLLLALHCFCSCNGASMKSLFNKRDKGVGLNINDIDSERFDSMGKVDLNKRWSLFKSAFNKTYQSEAHEAERMRIFAENQMKILRHNRQAINGMHTYTLGMNQFGDMTNEEFVKTMNGFKKNYAESRGQESSTFLPPLNARAPDAVDWRTQGYVTPVKNQGHCGSCWSFSSTGALEGQHFRKTGQLVSLSEQNLVDCSKSFGNDGCNGGLMDNAFKYIKANKGIDTEASYPYEAKDDKCQFNPKNVGADDTGFVDVTSGDEDQLKQAVGTVGPVSIAIDASHDSFQFYKKGVYHESECSSTELDHGVLVVGYGTTDQGEDYWIVKNSWGMTWGDQGYIYMARNAQNQCGVATAASYPLV